jgi:hypothetical protein
VYVLKWLPREHLQTKEENKNGPIIRQLTHWNRRRGAPLGILASDVGKAATTEAAQRAAQPVSCRPRAASCAQARTPKICKMYVNGAEVRKSASPQPTALSSPGKKKAWHQLARKPRHQLCINWKQKNAPGLENGVPPCGAAGCAAGCTAFAAGARASRLGRC